jgi:hypothetical protein
MRVRVAIANSFSCSCAGCSKNRDEADPPEHREEELSMNSEKNPCLIRANLWLKNL